MPFFEARNLHKRFGSRVVLENISLGFEKGQVSGIMGPNGAGKTTCFHVLTGLHKPDRGEIELEGISIAGLPPQRIATLGVSRSSARCARRTSPRSRSSTRWRSRSDAAPGWLTRTTSETSTAS